jgi:hypothetical protein
VGVDPILVALVAWWVAAHILDRWWITRRVAATECSECGQAIGRTAARRRRKLQFACKEAWALTCGRCGSGQLVGLGPFYRR